jgi:ribosomal protein L16 Arg81 hydroxylase
MSKNFGYKVPMKENHGVGINEGEIDNSKFASTINEHNQTISGNNNITALGNNSTFNQSLASKNGDEEITATKVVEMLAHLEERIQSLTVLSETDREKSVKRLEAAQVEAQESEPDKDSIANSLKRVNNTLKEAGTTTIEVKELVDELFPTVKKVAGYLGYAVGTIWSMLP